MAWGNGATTRWEWVGRGTDGIEAIHLQFPHSLGFCTPRCFTGMPGFRSTAANTSDEGLGHSDRDLSRLILNDSSTQGRRPSFKAHGVFQLLHGPDHDQPRFERLFGGTVRCSEADLDQGT